MIRGFVLGEEQERSPDSAGLPLRKWNESRVVLEHHYDHQQSGEPLTQDDLGIDAPKADIGFQNPS
jgi:hypothetical protein